MNAVPRARGGRRRLGALLWTAVVLPIVAYFLAARVPPGPSPEAPRGAGRGAPGTEVSARRDTPPVAIRLNERHVFGGEINRSGRAVGFHSRPGGRDPATARVTRILDPPNGLGVYRARVEILDPDRRVWVPKNAPSTFFPDDWTRERILVEIDGAFRARRGVREGYWEGRSPSGLRIGGYLDRDGDINTAFPIY